MYLLLIDMLGSTLSGHGNPHPPLPPAIVNPLYWE